MRKKIIVKTDVEKLERLCIESTKKLPREKSLELFFITINYLLTLERDFNFHFVNSKNERHDPISLLRTYYCERPFDLYS